MKLVRADWNAADLLEFKKWARTLKGDENNCAWEQRIVNTKLECFARTSAKAKEIVKEIKKGNYLSFLDNLKIENHLESIVYAYLLNGTKDFKTYKKYLFEFIPTIDNWASTDVLKFAKIDSQNLVELSKELLKSDKTFARRIGVNIWFELIKRDGFLCKAFEVLDDLGQEEEYYVNMCGAWLLAECMTKNRDKTIEYFENNHTNSFVINKAISKCRDSFRVKEEDKELLLKFKRKTQNRYKKL